MVRRERSAALTDCNAAIKISHVTSHDTKMHRDFKAACCGKDSSCSGMGGTRVKGPLDIALRVGDWICALIAGDLHSNVIGVISGDIAH